MLIVFYGCKGVGKTFVGRHVSALFSLPFFDLDEIIENVFFQQYGKSLGIQGIYSFLGETKFREMETIALKTVDINSLAVLSLGGGTLLFRENLEILKEKAFLIFLESSFDTVKSRLRQLPRYAQNWDDFALLFQMRTDIYKTIESIKIDVDNPSFLQALEKIIRDKLNGI